MGDTADYLAGLGSFDGDDEQAIIDATFGDFELQPRGYSRAKQPGSGLYGSWDDYIARSSESERMRRCASTAKHANRKRRESGHPIVRVTKEIVWVVTSKAQGRCYYCGSLAVEELPHNPKTGAPLPWEHMGRRIGSLEHVKARCDGGSNAVENLAWACLWCNTWKVPQVHQKGALDHGGFYPAVATNLRRAKHGIR